MKISVDWIKDFVNLPEPLDAKELSEKVTLGICEVEGWEKTGEMLNKVVVAEIKSVAPHPDADKLHLATIDLGGGKEAVVVCGADNCKPGIKAPYASLGTEFPGGFKLEAKKIRGVLSEGMLCAEDELGLSENHDGLMELSEDAPVGKPLAEALKDTVEDIILDIDNKSLTHRPDLWGHYGMAREFAAVYEKPFIDKFNKEWAEKIKQRINNDGGSPPVTVHVEKDSANKGFLALSVDNIKVGESPQWMQRRLTAAGMRPINSIVDISNYVMLETGMPNHIFDRSTIKGGKIIVRRAGSEQDFVTLDEQVRKLIPSDTLVCDAERPSAIAGVMGGLESSVSQDTTSIMIELANWDDAEIRRTSTRLGLRTDASQRYEKSLDSQQLEKALLRIFELVLELNHEAKAAGGIQSANMSAPADLVIETGHRRISAVLGEEVSEEKMTTILEALGFQVEKISGVSGENARTHKIHVPTWRSTKDIECEADIVEEIGRIIGYDNITPVSPVHEIEALRLSPAKSIMRKAGDFLVLRGRALEIYTYPLVGRALLEKAFWPVLNEKLTLANALTPEHDRMRPSLIPSLLEAASLNRKEHGSFRIFEIGRSYKELDGKDFSKDLYQTGVVFQEAKENPFIELADTMEELISCLGLPGRLVPWDPSAEHPLVPAGWPGSHPHEILDIQIMGSSRGIVFSLHPQAAGKFKLKGKTAVAVLDLTEVMSRPVKDKISFRSLDRFPGSDFDLTVVTPADTHAADVLDVIKKLKIKEIRQSGVLDIFELEDKKKALTLHIEFRDSERTLDAEFIKDTEEKIIKALDKAGYPLR